MSKRFEEVFRVKKPLIAMLHLKGDSNEEVLERTKKEIEVYLRNGVDAIVVENYFGNYYQMRSVLEYITQNYPDIVYGVNCLNFDSLGFKLAREYKAKFIQLDSVVGHVKPRDEPSMEAFLKEEREITEALLLGGVRFKYQPVLSQNSVHDDLQIAKDRCDVVVVTSDATGQETDLNKIKSFRESLGDFPLIVGAGITIDNAKEQMLIADGAIVGSYFKEEHVDANEINEAYVQELVRVFKEIREEV